MMSAKPRESSHRRKRKPVRPGVKRRPDGKLLKGTASINPKGRPKDHSFRDELLKAMQTTEKEERKSLLVHYCRRAFTNDRVLISLISRLIPELRSVEFQGSLSTMPDDMIKNIQTRLRERFNSKI